MTGTSPAIVGTASITSTDGAANGGTTFIQSWDTQSGTDGVPGIGGSGWVNEGFAIDWNTGVMGFATITFGGPVTFVVTNPILLFNFLDAVVETFDFADGLTLALLDQNPAASVVIAAGNVVTTNASHSDNVNHGFALQITGSFASGSSITFDTNTNLNITDSVGFTIAGNEALPVELIQFSVD